MANIISAATGNFTAAGTWGAVDSVSELDSEAASTAVSTSTLDSATFVLPATQVDAVAIKLAARAASPTGTLTVTLRNNTTPGTRDFSVTVNISDLPSSGLGWVLFKAGSAVTPNGTDSYLVRVVCSNTGSQVTLYRNATSNNWSRKIRTTTTQAPASGNHIVVANELTGAGTSNAITVTMDNTATTSWGPTVSGGPPQGIVVSGGGTLTWGSGNNAYYFKWKGVFWVCGGGTVNVGTSGGRMPTGASAVLEMDSAANLDTLIKVDLGGNWNSYGASKTAKTTLTADAAAAATTLTVGDTTGWQNGDVLGFTPTGSVYSEVETKAITSVTNATTVVVAALTNAHTGTSPKQAYVINLTRNIVFRGISTSLRGCFLAKAGAGVAVVLDNCEFTTDKLGLESGSQRPIDIQVTTGSFTMTDCTGNPSAASTLQVTCLYINGGATNNITINGFRSWNWRSRHVRMDTTTGANITVKNCFAASVNATSDAVPSIDLESTLVDGSGNIAFGNASGATQTGGAIRIGVIRGATWTQLTGSVYQNLEAAYGKGAGIEVGVATVASEAAAIYGLNWKVWRNNGCGVTFSAPLKRMVLDTLLAFGNGTGNNANGAVDFQQGCALGILIGCTLAGDTTISSASGISNTLGTATAGNVFLMIFNTTFGQATGIYNAFTSADIALSNPGISNLYILANNCLFSTTPIMLNLTDATGQQPFGDHIDDGGSWLRCQKYNQTAGDHRTFVPQGTIQTDTTIFYNASPAERLTPNTASYKLRSGPRRAKVKNTATRTITVRVRKSVVGDGAAYNGNQPRLLLRRNDAVGFTTDNVVLATAAGAAGSWEQLSGVTTPSATDDGAFEVYMDCDGTAGWVDVDDWNVV